MELTNRYFYGTFHKTGRHEWDRATYCSVIVLMFKEETVKKLARENRVKLFSNMIIKGVPEISFSGDEDLLKKIRGTFSESYGQAYTYCEIDFRADANNPIPFPDSFECIIADNVGSKAKIETILDSMKVKPPVYVSAFPPYDGP